MDGVLVDSLTGLSGPADLASGNATTIGVDAQAPATYQAVVTYTVVAAF